MSSEIYNVIREMLWVDWDPIGLNSNPKLADEYDLYVERLSQLVMSSSGKLAYIDYLRDIETSMGVCSMNDKLYTLGAKLEDLERRHNEN